MEKTHSEKFFIQSISRALTIVSIIAKSNDQGLTLTEISEKVDLPISTVYRILQNLISFQYVKDNENGLYTLGFELITLGNVAKSNIKLIKIAQRYLSELSDLTKETIYLATLDEKKGDVMYVDKIDSKGNIKLATAVGSRNFIHSTANGKVLVSGLSDEKIENLLKLSNLPKITENTITNVKDFIIESRKSKLQGYAIDNIENEPGVRCVAAPIYDYKNKIVASISISGVVSNITLENIKEKYAPLVMDAALKTSLELGFRK